MPEYHVNCGISRIYAGTLRKDDPKRWQSSTDVTDEAIGAVASWLYKQIKEGETSYSYSWKTTDGKKLILTIKIEEDNELYNFVLNTISNRS